MSSKLSLHRTKHDKWDDKTIGVIKNYENRLIKDYGKLDIPPVPKEVMKEVLLDIEDDLLYEMNKLPAKVILK